MSYWILIPILLVAYLVVGWVTIFIINWGDSFFSSGEEHFAAWAMVLWPFVWVFLIAAGIVWGVTNGFKAMARFTIRGEQVVDR